MSVILDYENAKQALYEHVDFKEDWVVYAIDNQTDMFWTVYEDRKFVRFAKTLEKLKSKDGAYYENEIYTQRFYSKWVYRGKDFTMIIVDTHTDGNKFFEVFDNAKEVVING